MCVWEGSDALNRRTGKTYVSNPDGGSTYYSYPSTTETVTQQDQTTSGDKTLKSVSLYDGFGRPVETDSYEGGSGYIAATQSYDGLGRVGTATNPSRAGDELNFGTSYAYDGLSRTTSVKTFDGGSQVTAYTGNTTTVTDQANHARTYTVDGLGRLTNVVEDPAGLNYSTSYAYDVLGDLTLVTQGKQTRTFAYDSLGRLQWSWQPESATINYRYDNNGNVTWRDDYRGAQTTLTYDSLNRLTGKTYVGATTPSVTYSYDPAVANGIGQLGSVSNSSSTTNYLSFDAMGRVLSSNQATAGTTYRFSYTYNLAGAMATETYPSGRVVTMAYDGANRVSGVSGSLGGATTQYVSGLTYAPHGGYSGHSYANGLARLYSYNSRLQLQETTDTVSTVAGCGAASKAAYTGQNQFLMDLVFYWGGSGSETQYNNGSLQGELINNCLGGAASNFWETFGYDGVNRLTAYTDNGGGTTSARTMGYDAFGNMSLVGNSAALPLSPLLPNASQINSSKNQVTMNGTAQTAYDAAGNITTYSNGLTATYDAEERQTAAGTATYGYDGLGQRVVKAVNGVTTYYVYDAVGQLVAEYAAGDASKPPCVTCYLSWDHLGTTRMVTDQNGGVVARHDFMPFGEELLQGDVGRTSLWGSSDFVNQKFTGQERDGETGLDYFHARYFGSGLGRFSSPDPGNAGVDLSDPQTWNGYAYVRNNPMSAVDPSGMDTSNDCGGPCTPFAISLGGGCSTFITYYNQTDSTGTWAIPSFSPIFCPPSLLQSSSGSGGNGGGGGSGKTQPPAKPKTGPCNVQYAVDFVQQNQPAATQVARQLGVSPEDILGLSAAETGYGRSAIAQQANNFFSLHGDSTAPYASGVRRAGDGPMSAFPSYLASAQSFAAQYGYLVQGQIDPSAFANALVPRFNSAQAPLGNPNFVPNLVIVIKTVKIRMGC